MKISEFSVNNTLLVNALSVFIVIVGLLSLGDIEREAFSNFSFDIVVVETHYPGSPPEVVEKRITMPIEEELREVGDIDKMSSVSLEGISYVILELDPDVSDKNRVISEIERAVEEAKDLPEDLDEKPRVTEIQSRDQPLVEVSLSGDLPEGELRELARNLETEIRDLKGVAKVARKGMRDREIWVEVDPGKMESRQIALSDVMAALSARNVNVAGGLHKGSTGELILRTTGELENAKDVGSVIIRANEEGHWVQVGDVAEVSDRFEELQILNRTDGSRAMNLLVLKKDDADAIRLMDNLKALLDDFRAKNTPRLKMALVNDISYYVRRRLNVLLSNGWMGAILVLIPMIIFLSPRIAAGSVMGMVVAILAAVSVMKFFGISINLISMFGMIMVLGMLVDEDLVVSDNIAHYLDKGLPYKEAAIRGASEVSRPILSTVLTTIIAFVPLLFMSGIFGKFVRDIPLVVIITLSASLLEALVILPSHLADLSKPRGDGSGSAWKRKKQHHLFDRFRNAYTASLRYCLSRPVKTSLVSIFVAVSVILAGVFGIKFILFPSKGIEAFFIRAEAKMGTSLEETEKMIRSLERFAETLPLTELDHFVTQVGIVENDPNDPFSRMGSHLAQIEVYLKPENHRERTADDIMADLRLKIPEGTGFEQIRFDTVKPGPPVGKPVAVRIRGDDYGILKPLAEICKKELGAIKGVGDIRDDYEKGKGELRIVVDEKTASRAGLSYQDVALTVRQAFEGMKATTIRKTDDEVDVIVRLPENLRRDLDAVESLPVMNREGRLVPLGRVASLERAEGVTAISHFDGKRTITVTANVDEDVTTSRDVNRFLKEKLALLSREHPGVTFHYGGEEESTEESMQSLYNAFYAAILLIFVVLLVTFGSLPQTLVILLAIPFGAVGVVIGFAIAGEPFSFLAILGIVGLTGIVVDGGTLIFDFINRRRREGAALKEAILDGCSMRLRSILLTTLTTVLGVIPAAYGLGGSDPFIRPMALALNWGLAVSTFFTLYTLPCLYYLGEEGMTRLGALLKFSRKKHRVYPAEFP